MAGWFSPTLAGRGRRLPGDDEELRRREPVDVARTPSGLLLHGHHRAD